jgi:hypothetical protein
VATNHVDDRAVPGSSNMPLVFRWEWIGPCSDAYAMWQVLEKGRGRWGGTMIFASLLA